jgi:hypothetical protein
MPGSVIHGPASIAVPHSPRSVGWRGERSISCGGVPFVNIDSEKPSSRKMPLYAVAPAMPPLCQTNGWFSSLVCTHPIPPQPELKRQALMRLAMSNTLN